VFWSIFMYVSLLLPSRKDGLRGSGPRRASGASFVFLSSSSSFPSLRVQRGRGFARMKREER
jgi:hypothetical protein